MFWDVHIAIRADDTRDVHEEQILVEFAGRGEKTTRQYVTNLMPQILRLTLPSFEDGGFSFEITSCVPYEVPTEGNLVEAKKPWWRRWIPGL